MEIQDIKSHLTITEVLAHYGIKSDRNNRVKCPWHDDKTPSLQIYPKTNTWTCFSSNCNAGSGDVIEFIMKKENCNKHEALVKATAMTGLSNSSPIQQVNETTKANETYTRQAILLKYYQSTLQSITQSPNARA